MASGLVALDQAPGHPNLISLALSPHPSTTDMIAAAGADPLAAIDRALAKLEADLAPVPADAGGRQRWRDAIGERLSRLAAKIAPAMSVEQASAWRAAVSDALSDLPAMVALTAAKRAIHRPMQFLNEVEGAIRDAARDVVAQRALARARMETVKRKLEQPPVLALPPQVENAPLYLEEVRAMAPWLRQIGLDNGWLTQAEIDAADAEAMSA